MTPDPLGPEVVRRIRLRYDRMAPSALASAFFEHLSRVMPDVRALLPDDLATHVQHVDAAIALVIRNLGDLPALQQPLEELGAEHARHGVLPEQLAAAHDVLLAAARGIAGRRWSGIEERDWSAAFAALLTPVIRGARRVRDP